MVHLLEEPPGLQLLEVGLVVRLHDLAHRDPRRPELLDDRVGGPLVTPGLQVLVDGVMGRHPPGGRGQGRVRSPARLAQRQPEGRPLRVGLDRDRHPAVPPALVVLIRAQVEVLGRRHRAPVARPLEQGAVGRVLDHLLGRDVEGGVDHGRLHQAALAGVVPVLEGQQQPDQGVQPGIGVPDAVGLDGEEVLVSGQPGQPGGVLDHEGERRQVPPRAVEAEPGHADHDQVRAVGLQGLEAQAELVQHPGCVVLHDHVAGGHEAVQQLDAPRVAQVEGQAPLVGVEGGEDRPPLPPLRLRRRDAADQAEAVGALGRLEVDDVGAEQGQQAADQWPGPVGRHVEDPQPTERERAAAPAARRR